MKTHLNSRSRARSLFLVACVPIAAVLLLAACDGGKSKPGIPINGSIASANGTTAPLTVNNGIGTGFSLNAVLGSANVVVSAAAWKCYSPAPPQYPNYDIEATDRESYGMFISISPVVWSSGGHLIDNTNITVFVTTRDRYGFATAGTLTLLRTPSIPDAAGQECSFELSGVPLVGEKDG